MYIPRGPRGFGLAFTNRLRPRWAAHHVRIRRLRYSNLGCGEWPCSWQASRGAQWLPQSVARSPDGRHITSGSQDNTIRIWDSVTGCTVGGPLEARVLRPHHLSLGCDRIPRGMLGRYCLLLPLPMDGILTLGPMTASLEPEIRRLDDQSSLLLTLRTGDLPFLGLTATPPVCRTHFHICPFDLPLVIQNVLASVQSPTLVLGQGLQRWPTLLGTP